MASRSVGGTVATGVISQLQYFSLQTDAYIPATGGAIFASNHLSVADELLLGTVVPRHLAFWAKSEYFTGTGLKGGFSKFVLTGLGGAAAVIAGWFILIGKVPSDNVTWWEVGQLIRDSWVYLIAWGLIAAAGILAQLRGPEMGPDSYQLERTSYRYG